MTMLFWVILIGSVFIAYSFINHNEQKKQITKLKNQLDTWSRNLGYSSLSDVELGHESQDKSSDEWISTLNFSSQKKEEHTPKILEGSSFASGKILRGFRGEFEKAKNGFAVLFQKETRNSGKRSYHYYRTITAIEIPDTQLHLIINSKINNDATSGNNLDHFSAKQRLTLEGDFGTFFDVYMPEKTQSETLTFLSPDNMSLLLAEFSEYDIEINGNQLFLYTYRHLYFTELEQLLHKLEVLLMELRLRKTDGRKEKITNNLVARTATDSTTLHRSLNKDFSILGFLFLIVYFTARLTDHPAVVGGLLLIFIILGVKTTYDGAYERKLKKKYNNIVGAYKNK